MMKKGQRLPSICTSLFVLMCNCLTPVLADLTKEKDKVTANEAYRSAMQQVALKANKSLKISVKEEDTSLKKLLLAIQAEMAEVKTSIVNQKLGIVVIGQEGDFSYPKNSVLPQEEGQKKIRKVFELIQVQSSLLEKVEILGHASPQFGGKYHPPHLTKTRGHLYNLDLSQKRAKEIEKIAMEQNGLKGKVYSKGLGHLHPIEFQGAILNPSSCGKYDCRASRRIEIILHLK